MTDHAESLQKWHKFLEADKQHQKLDAICKSIDEKISEQDKKINDADYKIMKLVYVRDIVEQKSFDLQVLSEKHEEFSKNVLGTTRGVDCLYEMLCDLVNDFDSQKRDAFLLAGEAVAKRKELEERSQTARKAAHTRFCQVRAEYNKLEQQAETAKQAQDTTQAAEAE